MLSSDARTVTRTRSVGCYDIERISRRRRPDKNFSVMGDRCSANRSSSCKWDICCARAALAAARRRESLHGRLYPAARPPHAKRAAAAGALRRRAPRATRGKCPRLTYPSSQPTWRANESERGLVLWQCLRALDGGGIQSASGGASQAKSGTARATVGSRSRVRVGMLTPRLHPHPTAPARPPGVRTRRRDQPAGAMTPARGRGGNSRGSSQLGAAPIFWPKIWSVSLTT